MDCLLTGRSVVVSPFLPVCMSLCLWAKILNYRLQLVLPLKCECGYDWQKVLKGL